MDNLGLLQSENALGLKSPGYRYNSTDLKGRGYFGPLRRPDGRVSTELSIGVNGTEIPSLVPTLSLEELQYLMAGGQMTPEIVQKAKLWADTHKSPFASGNQIRAVPLSDFLR